MKISGGIHFLYIISRQRRNDDYIKKTDQLDKIHEE